MDGTFIPSPNLAETQKEIRDPPAALLKLAFDLLIPTDRAPSATFWATYNDDIGLRATTIAVCLILQI